MQVLMALALNVVLPSLEERLGSAEAISLSRLSLEKNAYISRLSSDRSEIGVATILRSVSDSDQEFDKEPQSYTAKHSTPVNSFNSSSPLSSTFP